MTKDELARGFLGHHKSMQRAKALVVYKFNIPQHEFQSVLNGAIAKACNKWDEDRSQFNSYVITCLRSECIDHLRRSSQPYVDLIYADNASTSVDMWKILHMKDVLERVLDRITDSEHADLLLRVLVCGENYVDSGSRKIVERFRTKLRDEFAEELV